MLHYHIRILKVRLVNRFILFLRILLGEENLYRHK